MKTKIILNIAKYPLETKPPTVENYYHRVIGVWVTDFVSRTALVPTTEKTSGVGSRRSQDAGRERAEGRSWRSYGSRYRVWRRFREGSGRQAVYQLLQKSDVFNTPGI